MPAGLSSPDRSARAGLLTVLCIGHFLAFFDRSLLSAVLPLVKAEFALSDRDLGLLQGTLFAAAYVIGCLCCARVDARRRPLLLLGGLMVWTAGEAGCALSASATGLGVGQMLVGLGQAAFVPAAVSIVAGAGPAMGRALSLFTAGSTLGRSISVLGAGAMLAWLAPIEPRLGGADSWRSLYAIVTLAGLLLLGLLAATLRAGQPANPAPPPPLRPWLIDHGGSIAGIVAAILPVILLIQSIAAWMPTLSARTYGLGTARAAMIVGGVTLLTAPAGQLLGGGLFDRVPVLAARPFATLAGTMAIACAATWTIAVAPGLPLALLALAIANLVLGIGSLIGLATLQTMVPPALRNRVNALFFALVTAVGFGIGPLLVGTLSDARGAGAGALGHALAQVAVGALVACVAAGILTRAAGQQRA